MEFNSENKQHILNDEWSLWSHLPHDTNWTLDSYKEVCSINSVEQSLSLIEYLPARLVKNCMLFIMRKGIKPTWEDPANAKGGCFSYKVSNKTVPEFWRKASYTLLGETLSSNQEFQKTINGITISPKKNFCIIKIWTKTGKYQNSKELDGFEDLSNEGTLFRMHQPEF
jgi:translation initiation factor 4E